MPDFDALLLAASRAVDPNKVDLDRHMVSALAAGAFAVGMRISDDQTPALIEMLRRMMRRNHPGRYSL